MSELIEDPALAIIDAHHHLWHHPPQRPSESYLASDYVNDLSSGHRVVATVHVECNSAYDAGAERALRPVGETRWINDIAELTAGAGVVPRIAAGIVGYADLSLGERVEEVLQAHLAAAPGRFKGIRQTCAWDAFDGLRYRHLEVPQNRMSDPAFLRGFAKLSAYGLSFDCWVFHPQLLEVMTLAARFPQTTLVINHLGGPLGIGPYVHGRDEILAQWRRDLSALATLPNVVMKLGGTAMHCCGFDFAARPTPVSSDDLAAATRTLYLHAIDCFSPARCMFESNFPVDKNGIDATVLWNSFKKITADFSVEERKSLFNRTAAQTYRLTGTEL